jgi:hypothetical protein
MLRVILIRHQITCGDSTCDDCCYCGSKTSASGDWAVLPYCWLFKAFLKSQNSKVMRDPYCYCGEAWAKSRKLLVSEQASNAQD